MDNTIKVTDMNDALSGMRAATSALLGKIGNLAMFNEENALGREALSMGAVNAVQHFDHSGVINGIDNLDEKSRETSVLSKMKEMRKQSEGKDNKFKI